MGLRPLIEASPREQAGPLVLTCFRLKRWIRREWHKRCFLSDNPTNSEKPDTGGGRTPPQRFTSKSVSFGRRPRAVWPLEKTANPRTVFGRLQLQVQFPFSKGTPQ